MSKEQQALPQNKQGIRQYLPQIMLVLFMIQPMMDVISFWLDALGTGNTISLLMRFAVLFGTAALGFFLSRRKRVYCIFGAVVVVLAILHVWACMMWGYNGYGDPVYDLINYIRVVQIPLFTFCFITFLRETGEEGYRAIERGFVVNFGIIVIVEAASALTGTNPYTYANKEIGLLGWFVTPSAQSAIISVLAPVLLMQVIRKKKLLYTAAGTAVCFGVLYLFATRLTYVTIFICAAGLTIVILLSQYWNKKAIAVVLAGAVLCGAGYMVSPMYHNQVAQKLVAAEKQQEADELIAQTERINGTTVEQSPEICLQPLYEEYLGAMVDRFGETRVLEEYSYTTDVSELKDWRRMKIIYCSFLMEEAGTMAKVFGMELADMTWMNEVFDVENDFHGIYFLYGIVGLIVFLLFMLYFIWLVLYALVTAFSKYMTLEAGAFGVAFCTLLLHIYCTAGVLRRPNASFYLSVVLAVIYYFVKIKKYQEPPAYNPLT
ncbi:MAG: O-antigen ligase family protein [Clostridia bacterium]|nr:O-antigen ligase family protein [Clostridia bacterium]